MVDQNQGLRYAVWNVLCLFDAQRAVLVRRATLGLGSALDRRAARRTACGKRVLVGVGS